MKHNPTNPRPTPPHPEPRRGQEGKGKPTGKAKPIISVNKLNVTYFPGRSNEVRALKDISLDIYPGEYVIFFGPSGCGKSTLLYSLAGLERNTEGSIMVKDKNLATISQRELEEYYERTIGMIFQSYYLIPSLNVAQNVALPQVAVGGAKAQRMKRAVELLEKFGVGAQAWKLPTELSGGQQQRVAICRSLINEPDILVADEPVGNLDSKSTKDVMDLLRYLNDVQKKTVILVTHDPSHLYHANRIFYLRDGVIINTKTNTEEERKQSIVQEGGAMAMSAALSHWIRTFAPPKVKPQQAAQVGRETQEILAETLTGMSADELLIIEQKLYKLLSDGTQGAETIYAFLHKPVKKGGVGMKKYKAKRIAQEMQSLARKVKRLRNREPRLTEKDEDLTLTAVEAREIRKSLLEHCDLTLSGLKAVAALDVAIQKRLEGKIDALGVQKLLSRSVKRGGVGLGLRTARKVSLLLEPFITYKPDYNPNSTPLSGPASPSADASH